MKEQKTAEKEKIDLVEANEPGATCGPELTEGTVPDTVPDTVPGTVPDTVPGTVIAGRYELISLIGSGGMGRVYKARDLSGSAIVAIKLISPERLHESRGLERFKQEAGLAARLNHENIAAVKEFGQDDTFANYLVMEYVEGSTLLELMRQEGALPASRAVGIIEQICAGVKCAHDQNIVHRDLKPSNIVLVKSSDGKDRVKILDFGVAGVIEQAGRAHRPLTETGEMLGTPWYMSPEQCFGQPCDRRTDVYQLGCLFYELLTGRKPFEGANAFDVMYKHVTGELVLEGLSEPMRGVVEKAMNKNPDERYESIEKFFAAVRQAGNKTGTPASSRAIYQELLERSTGALSKVVPRRLAAGGLDGLIVGISYGLIIICLSAAKFIPQHDSYGGFPHIIDDVVNAFKLGVFDSFLVFPTVFLTLLPAQFLWWVGGLSDYVPFLNSFHFMQTSDANLVPFCLLLFNWLYHALFECSKLGATPGKVIFGLGVRTGVMQTPSFWKASRRHFSKAISMLLIPELARFCLGLARKGPGKAGEQFARQLRCPLNDLLSSCAVGIKTPGARKAIAALLSACAAILAFFAFPWAAVYFQNYDLALSLNPGFAQARELRAGKLYSRGKLKEAIADLALAQKQNPKKADIYARQAVVLYQLHDYGAALAALKEGGNACADSDADRLKSMQMYIMAIAMGDNKGAAEIMKQLPHKYVDPILRAHIMQSTGAGPEAFELADGNIADEWSWYAPETLKIMAHDRPDIFLDRAIVANVLNHKDRAIEFSTRAIDDSLSMLQRKKSSIRPDPKYVLASAYLLQGEIKEKDGDSQGAEEDFRKAIEGFNVYIESRQGREPRPGYYYNDYLDNIQKLGKAYLGRSRAYEKIGDQMRAKADRAYAREKLGVLTDYQCNEDLGRI